MLTGLDHAVLAVRDLPQATERTAALLGRAPSWRGEHPGEGTANALFQLEGAYVELLAAAGDGPIGLAVASRLETHGEGLTALAFATDDAAGCAARLRAAGLGDGEMREGEGCERDGTVRRWRTTWVAPTATRGIPLFAIEHLSPGLAPREPDAGVAGAVAGLDHVVIASSDLGAAGDLYGEGLGLRLALDRRFEARGLRILFFRVGGVTVEVVGRLDASPGATGEDRFGGLAWRVPDAEAARARLLGAEFDVSEVRDGAKPGTRVCTVRGDPCGVPTLLIEPAATRPAG